MTSIFICHKTQGGIFEAYINPEIIDTRSSSSHCRTMEHSGSVNLRTHIAAQIRDALQGNSLGVDADDEPSTFNGTLPLHKDSRTDAER